VNLDIKHVVFHARRLAVLLALLETDGNRRQAAIRLGIERSMVQRYLQQYEEFFGADPDFIAWNEKHP
jgi:DNA-binding protein Fis